MFQYFLCLESFFFASSSSSQVTEYITGRGNMKTKCQFTSYKSTIKFSYSQPPKKNKEKKKAKNAPATKTKNSTHTQQLRDKKFELRLLKGMRTAKARRSHGSMRSTKAIVHTQNAQKKKKTKQNKKERKKKQRTHRPWPQQTYCRGQFLT